jgi:hypothetical protein
MGREFIFRDIENLHGEVAMGQHLDVALLTSLLAQRF